MKSKIEAPKSVPKNFESMDFTELDKPAFIRKHKEEKVNKSIPAITSPQKTNVYILGEDDIPDAPDELDTPTFLRKQMD